MPILRKSGFQSISPPTPQISRPLEAIRGPSSVSSSIAFFSQKSMLNKLPPLRAAVYPQASARLALVAASSVTYSTGYLMSRSSKFATLKYVGWKCASTSPGMIVPPRASIRRTSGPTAGAAAEGPAYTMRPSRISTAALGTAAAPVPSMSWPPWMSVVPNAVFIVRTS